MFNLEEQREFIRRAGYETCDCGTQNHIFYDDFDFIAERWNLSDELREYVGSEGRISFPMDFENRIMLEDNNGLPMALRRIEIILSDIFRMYYNYRYYSADMEEGPEKTDLDDKLRNIRVSGVKVDYKMNKVIVKADKSSLFIRNAAEERIGLQQRKSAMKTLEKLAMDVFTKEFYPIISKTEYFKKSWTELEEEVNSLQNIVSKNISSKGRLYLSALPEDLLTASTNAYNWRSCFSYDGEYSNIPFEYMRNENTMIAFYIPNDAKNKKFGHAGMEVYNKPWRMLVHLTGKGNLALARAQYPTQSDDLANKVAEIFSVAFEGEVFNHISVEREGNKYFEDTDKYINIHDGWNQDNIQDLVNDDFISDEKTVCTVNGHYIGDQDNDPQAFRDYDELEIAYCESCEETFSRDEMVSVEGPYGMDQICSYCADDLDNCYYTGTTLAGYGSKNIVIESEGSGAVRATEDSYTDLEDSGNYHHATLYSKGYRWGSEREDDATILIHKDIEVINVFMIQSVLDYDNCAQSQVFHLELTDLGESAFENEYIYDKMGKETIMANTLKGFNAFETEGN